MNVIAILNCWSPWHLRKRIAMLEESIEKLTDTRDELLAECNRTVVKENERLKRCYYDLHSVFIQNTDALERVLKNQRSACIVLEKEMKGDTHEQK